jgi:hypothetical protein
MRVSVINVVREYSQGKSHAEARNKGVLTTDFIDATDKTDAFGFL